MWHMDALASISNTDTKLFYLFACHQLSESCVPNNNCPSLGARAQAFYIYTLVYNKCARSVINIHAHSKKVYLTHFAPPRVIFIHISPHT
jgi:hypothetical protein